MEIKDKYPPNIQKIRETFSSYTFDNSQTFFAYLPYIYNPSGIEIPTDLLFHESIHLKQQGNNPEQWWDKYLSDAKFRLEQELEAYRQQYKFAKKIIKDRNKLAIGLMRMANCLSGPMYGNLLTQKEALEKIKK